GSFARRRSGASAIGVLLLQLDVATICELAHRVERTSDDLIAGLQPAEHFEILLARNSDFDWREDTTSTADDEHTFRLLAGVAGRWLIRRRHWCLDRVAPSPALRFFVYEVTLVVVEHLADSERLD